MDTERGASTLPVNEVGTERGVHLLTVNEVGTERGAHALPVNEVGAERGVHVFWSELAAVWSVVSPGAPVADHLHEGIELHITPSSSPKLVIWTYF